MKKIMRPMKFSFMLTLFFILFFITAGLAKEQAMDEIQISKYPQSTGECDITIFGNHQKNPKCFLENGVPKGILVEMFSYIGKEMGCNFTIKLNTWKRAYVQLLNGKGGIMGLSKNKERLKILDYSDVMFNDDLMIVVKKNHEFEYNSIEDFRGKRVVASRGASYGNEWDHGHKEKIFTFVEDNGNLASRITFVLLGRADIAIIGPGISAVNRAINEKQFLINNRDKISVLKTPFKRDPNFLGFAKSLKMTGFLKEFNKHLKKGYESGRFKKIIDKYNIDQEKIEY